MTREVRALVRRVGRTECIMVAMRQVQVAPRTARTCSQEGALMNAVQHEER